MKAPLLSCFVCICIPLSALAGEDPAKTLPPPEKTGELPADINESSGLVKSRRYPDKNIFWTHNDSGDSSRIFAVDGTGKLLRTVDIKHAQNSDWEEITMDEKGRLIICDIGDNNRDNRGGRRMGVVLYRLAEPDALDAEAKPDKPDVFHFDYPADIGPQNAEGAFARDGNMYVFSKQIEGTSCFKLPMPESAPAEHVNMTLVARTKTFNIVTGAALTADGKHLAIINYLSILVIDLPGPFETLKPGADGLVPLFEFPRRSRSVLLGQTEAVAWDNDDLVLTTEGRGMYRVKGATKVVPHNFRIDCVKL